MGISFILTGSGPRDRLGLPVNSAEEYSKHGTSNHERYNEVHRQELAVKLRVGLYVLLFLYRTQHFKNHMLDVVVVALTFRMLPTVH